MKRLLTFLLILSMSFTMTACGQEEKGNDSKVPEQVEDKKEETPKLDEGKEDQKDDQKDTEEPVEDKEEDKALSKKEVTLYFNNDKYIETGDENLDVFIPIKTEVEVHNGQLAKAVVDALTAGPKDQEGLSSIIGEVKVIDLNLKDKTIFVNLDSSTLNGGSLAERLIIGQFVNSLLELDGVEAVRFLIDGEESESLLGHIDTTEAFTEAVEME